MCILNEEAEIVDALVGDRSGDDHPTADVDADMRRCLTLGDPGDLALQLVASAKPHHDVLRCSGRSVYPIGYYVPSRNRRSDVGMTILGPGDDDVYATAR